MTKKEQAQGLWAIMGDEARSLAERLAAELELETIRKTAKVGLVKLLSMDGVDQAAVDGLLDSFRLKPLEEVVVSDPETEPPITTPIIEAQKAGEPLPKESRGLITAEVRRLLQDGDLTYAAIEAAVKAKYPDARTTTRSIASTASDLRKAKEDVPTRRVTAKAKGEAK